MGKFKHDEGFGSLFVNKKREGKQPNSTGTATMPFDVKQGEEIEIAVWVRESKNPEVGKFQSLKISKPYVKTEEKAPVDSGLIDSSFADMPSDEPF